MPTGQQMTDTCPTCNGTGVYSSPDDMGGETVTNSQCPDCAQTTDIDKAIAVDKAIGSAWLEYLDNCGFPDDGLVFLGSEFRRVIHHHIDPVVEALGNNMDDLVGVNKYLGGELTKLETELSELKAMCAEYMGEHDENVDYECMNCNQQCEEEPPPGERRGPVRCQNAECIAFKLREKSKT